MFFARKILGRKRVEDSASIQIQRLCRGHLGRRHVIDHRKELEFHRYKVNMSKRINRVYRGHRCRQVYRRHRHQKNGPKSFEQVRKKDARWEKNWKGGRKIERDLLSSFLHYFFSLLHSGKPYDLRALFAAWLVCGKRWSRPTPTTSSFMPTSSLENANGINHGLSRIRTVMIWKNSEIWEREVSPSQWYAVPCHIHEVV